MDHIRDFYKLSSREWQCLSLWACGFTAKGIGLKLRISPRTVESYIEQVKQKTGIFYKNDLINLFYKDKLDWK